MNRTLFLASSLAFVSAGCGHPARTETTTSVSRAQTSDGQDIQHTTSETTQVQADGSRTVEHTETTQTQTPPPSSTTPQ